MTTHIFLRGKEVVLRPPSETDIPLLTKWMNDPEIRPFMRRSFPVTEQNQRDWLESLSHKSTTEIVLIIVVKERPIGTISLKDINLIDRTAETSTVIGERDCWERGYATDAKMALLDHAFNVLNLRKVISRVKAYNRRSLGYARHFGYQPEGRLRKHYFLKGRYYDELILGLFKSEWLPHWKAYHKK